MHEKKCPKCGKMLPEGARFCGYCRRDVSEVSVKGQHGQGKAVPNPPQSDSRKAIIGVVLAVLVAMLLMNMQVCAICHKPIIGQSYYYMFSGSSGDRLDEGCASTYYGSLASNYRA